jgi:membrane protein
MERVDSVNGGVLGGVGLAFFIYTAISMVQKVEESFNFVWAVSKPRSFARRFVEYTVVLLVGPLAIVTALGMIAPIERELAEFESARVLIQETSRLMPYILVSATFAFLYVFMPNTRVKLSAAVVGGLTGGFLWASVGLIFTNFIMGSANRQAIYASFAVAIATLIWLYLNWIVLLIGSQVAYYFQNPAYLRIGRRAPRLSNSLRERLALNIMVLVGSAFRIVGQEETIGTLAEKLELPSVTIDPIVLGLESANLVTATEKGGIVPGRDINQILLSDILAVVRSEGETGSFTAPHFDPRVAALGQSLDTAVADTVTEQTLADLLDSS